MNTKQWIIPMVAATLTAYAHPALAECEHEGGNFVKAEHLLFAGNDHDQDRGRDNRHGHDNKNNRGNENSNRQSDHDSTRGLARAEERRGDKDHDKRGTEDGRRWYNPFGWKRPSEWFDDDGI